MGKLFENDFCLIQTTRLKYHLNLLKHIYVHFTYHNRLLKPTLRDSNDLNQFSKVLKMYKTVIRPLTDLQYIKKEFDRFSSTYSRSIGLSDLKYTMLKVEFIGSYRLHIQYYYISILNSLYQEVVFQQRLRWNEC